ncbi:PepSY domain-containing protein [Rhizobium phaseoli]|nr:PepSY domain-containing protein [Rhizobium phaseoli]
MQAIDAAERKFGGKAVDDALDNEQANPEFEIELMTE